MTMGNGSELGERIRDAVSRFSLRDRPTQIALVSIVVVLALIVAVVAWPSGEEEELAGSRGGETVDDVSGDPLEVPEGEAPVDGGDVGDDRSGPSDSSSSGGSSGSVGSEGSAGGASGPEAAGEPGGGAPPTAAECAPGTGAENAPGASDSEIKVGIVYDPDAGALNTAFGFAGVGQIDQKRAWDELVKHLNDTGGVCGRRVTPVFNEQSQLEGESQEQQAQQNCTAFTEDDRVFGVWESGNNTLRECLTEARVVQNAGGTGLSDAQTYDRFPYLVETGMPGQTRLARFGVDELEAEGYYAENRPNQAALPRKIGVVAYNDPVFKRAVDALETSLSSEGLALEEKALIRRAQSEAEIADEVAQIRQAVLQFKAAGVTHVQFFGTTNAFLQLTFWQQADDQEYYPRYGLTSIDAAQALAPVLDSAQGEGTAAKTFVDAVGVGWNPLFDVPREDYSGDKESEALQRCKEILDHETYDDPSRNKEALAAIACDAAFYFRAAVEAGGPSVTPESWLRGVANVGQTPSALTFDMVTTADRHDGMGAIRVLRFFEDCTCFHYTSPLKKV